MLKRTAHLWTGLFGGCFSVCVFLEKIIIFNNVVRKVNQHLERTSSLIHFEQIYSGVFLVRNGVTSIDLKSIKERNPAH